MPLRIIIRILITASVVFVSSGLTSGQAARAQDLAVATIDFASNGGPAVNRATGVLLSCSASEPPDEYLLPLKPRLFRTGSKIRPTGYEYYDRIRGLNAELMVMPSDEFLVTYQKWDSNAPWPGDGDDWTNWEAACRTAVRFAADGKYRVIWDIWNEPDRPDFWNRDQSQFFEAWKHGFRAIRSVDSKAVITGPSISWYSPKWMNAFLEFAKRNQVLPDILNWHELSPEGADRVPRSVRQARESMSALGIRIDRIMLPEIIAPDRQFQPGHAVKYMAAIHRAGVEAACHSCWPDPGWDGKGPKGLRIGNNCRNNSLDGLLTYEDKKPRSCWWAFRAYADLSGTLVNVQPQAAAFDGVASKDSQRGRAVVVLGRSENNLSAPKRDVTVRLQSLSAVKNLLNRGRVHVLARSIPDSDKSALAAPDVVIDANLPVQGDALVLELPNLGPEHAYWIVLSRAPTTTANTADNEKAASSSSVPRTARPAQSAKEQAAAYNGHAYRFFAERVTWKQARAKCAALGGHLVVIDAADENAFVAGLVTKAGGLDAWIGITDEVREGNWRTVDGRPCSYTNWFAGQPNNKSGREHFALMSNRTFRKSLGWAWADQPNETQEHQPGYVCEWDSLPPMQTTTKPRADDSPQVAKTGASVTIVRDIVYAKYGAREVTLDLYYPDKFSGRSLACVVVIHGGSWRSGNKQWFGPIARRLAENGFAAACINYRLLPEVSFPAPIEDCKAAVRWVRGSAAKYSLDPQRIAALGGSAGGHLAAMLATSHNLPELEGRGGNAGVSSRIQAAVAMAAPTDMTPFTQGLNLSREVVSLISPLTHVAGDAAPLLLVHGTADTIVPLEHALRLQAKYRQAGARAELVTFPEAPHVFWEAAEWSNETLEKSVRFLRETLDVKSAGKTNAAR